MKNIAILIALFLSVNAMAQKEKEKDVPVKQGANGVYILLSGKGLTAATPLYGQFTGATIQRAVNDDRYKEIGKVAAATSADEFEKMITKDALLSISDLKNLKGKAEAWAYVQAHPEIKDYGLLAMNLDLGVALGAYFLDKDAVNIPTGSVVKYKIVLTGGKQPAELMASLTKGQDAAWQKPFFIRKSESDSVIMIEWGALRTKSADVVFGNVYVKEGNPSEFKLLQKVFAGIEQRNDTIRFRVTHPVKPGIQFQYYVRPTTMALLEGPASDTVIATSVTFSTLDQPIDLKSKDSINGIYLTWKLAQSTNARRSIIIERASSPNETYKVLATLSPTALSYLDVTALPSFTYYYRIRIGTVANTILPPSSHITGSHVLTSFSPEPPRNVKAEVQKNGVKITWDKVNSPDIAGYYVRRNNGADTILEPLSLLVKETSFLDTTDLYGRNSYTYAVRASTFGNMNSEWSYSSAIRVMNSVKPTAPAGNKAYAEPGAVHLTWDDTKQNDRSIKRYNIYRKSGSLKAEKLTTASLKQAGFELAGTSDINTFKDVLNDKGEYQYAVTSVDIFGNESDIGFVQNIDAMMPYIVAPEFSVRKISKGIAIDWDITKQEGVKSYTIYKRSAGEKTAVKLTTVDITKGGYTDTNVKAGTLYYYSLSATGDYGTSGMSAEHYAKF